MNLLLVSDLVESLVIDLIEQEDSQTNNSPQNWLFPAGTVDFSVTVDFSKLVGAF